MTAIVWMRTKYGSLAHCQNSTCDLYKASLIGLASNDLPKCGKCLTWAAGTTYAFFGWLPPAIVADGRLLAEAAREMLTDVAHRAVDADRIRYWTVDDYSAVAQLPWEAEMWRQGYRPLRAEVHIPREDM